MELVFFSSASVCQHQSYPWSKPSKASCYNEWIISAGGIWEDKTPLRGIANERPSHPLFSFEDPLVKLLLMLVLIRGENQPIASH